jgi:hypothetical protein
MTKITTSDLLAAIQEYARQLPKRPPGKHWTTVKQMARRDKVSVSAIRQRFRLAIEHGLKVERFTGSDYDEAGSLVKQVWFRVKP